MSQFEFGLNAELLIRMDWNLPDDVRRVQEIMLFVFDGQKVLG
jgi:hypothetical protein